jgi:hypothetical protein
MSRYGVWGIVVGGLSRQIGRGAGLFVVSFQSVRRNVLIDWKVFPLLNVPALTCKDIDRLFLTGCSLVGNLNCRNSCTTRACGLERINMNVIQLAICPLWLLAVFSTLIGMVVLPAPSMPLVYLTVQLPPQPRNSWLPQQNSLSTK